MMRSKVLLTQFVLCCNSFTHIAGHIIVYTGWHLHKMHIPYVYMHAYVRLFTVGDTKKVTLRSVWGAFKRGTERVARAFSRLMIFLIGL